MGCTLARTARLRTDSTQLYKPVPLFDLVPLNSQSYYRRCSIRRGQLYKPERSRLLKCIPDIHKRIVASEDSSKDQVKEEPLELLLEYVLVPVYHCTHSGCRLARTVHQRIDLKQLYKPVPLFDLVPLNSQFCYRRCNIHRGQLYKLERSRLLKCIPDIHSRFVLVQSD